MTGIGFPPAGLGYSTMLPDQLNGWVLRWKESQVDKVVIHKFQLISSYRRLESKAQSLMTKAKKKSEYKS